MISNYDPDSFNDTNYTLDDSGSSPISASKNLSHNEWIGYACDQLFPNGTNVDDPEVCTKLNSYFRTNFNEDSQVKDGSILGGILNTVGFVKCDKNTYVPREKCPKISPALMQEINKFVVQHLPTVYYSEIYECFKDKLNSEGVNNRYLLKALIDPHFSVGMRLSEDCISQIERSAIRKDWTGVINTLHELSKKGPFSISDVSTRYPALKENTISYVLHKEETDSGLLYLSNKEYIYVEDAGIETDDAIDLIKFVQSIFKNYKYSFLNIRIVYTRLKQDEPDLLARLKAAGSNAFSLFSFVRLLGAATNLFVTNRPFISEGKPVPLKYIEIAYDCVKDYDTVTDKTISYINRQHYQHCDFGELSELASKTHVLVSDDKMIKKKLLEITDDEIADIKSILNIFIKRNEKVDTQAFNAYSSFPRLKYSWNKHLLAGVVRTYLNDKFSVERTGTTLSKSEYIIRRVL